MQVHFSNVGGDFPYKANYVGYATVALNARLAKGGRTGYATQTYGRLLEQVLVDLRGCSEPIEPTFSDNIGPEIQEVTGLLLKELSQNNSLEARVRRAREALSK